MSTKAIMTLKKWILVAGVSTAALALVTGCNEEEARDYAIEGEVWKSQIAEAFERNAALDNHRFSGDIRFHFEHTIDPKSEPQGAAIPMLSDGFVWEGVAYREPLRLEASVRTGTARGGNNLPPPEDIPLLIQDDVLYIHIPLLNEPEEYFTIDISGGTEGKLLPLQPLFQTAGAFDEVAKAIIAEVDPEWIRLANEDTTRGATSEDTPEAQASGISGELRHFVITVTDNNSEHLEQAFRDGWNAWSFGFPGELGASGSPGGKDAFDLAVGGTIHVTVNTDGFVTEQSIELSFIEPAAGQDEEERAAAEEIGHLAYGMQVFDMNAAPEMKKPIPQNTLPFEHVLTFLAAGMGTSAP